MKNKAIWAGVIGLVVGIILGWLIGNYSEFGKTNPGDKTNKTGGDSSLADDEALRNNSLNALFTNSGMSQESDSAILVVDQKAGSEVNVASVETDASVWVVVREDQNGVLGNILGASRIDAGASNNIVVSLLRPTEAGRTYQIVLFKDNEDRVFDHKVDLPLTSDSVLISKSFVAQ